MRPHRVRLTHSLVDSYGLGTKMLVNRPQPSTADELERFHADGTVLWRTHGRASLRSHRLSSKSVLLAEYVNFLSSVTPDNQDEYLAQMRRFNLGCIGEADCPVFDGVFEYCQVGIMVAAHSHSHLHKALTRLYFTQIYTGGSVNSAALMNDKQADICLNWSGRACQLPLTSTEFVVLHSQTLEALLEMHKVSMNMLAAYTNPQDLECMLTSVSRLSCHCTSSIFFFFSFVLLSVACCVQAGCIMQRKQRHQASALLMT